MSERQNLLLEGRNSNQYKIATEGCVEDNDERARQMKNLEDLQKELVEMKKKLNEASIRTHKLNIDVATMFNPQTLRKLQSYKEQCDVCLTRMSTTLNEPVDNPVQTDNNTS